MRYGRLACVGALLLLALAALPLGAQGVALALQRPSAVVYDASGNLYFAERAAHAVHRLAPDGTLTPIAGTGTQGFSGDGGPATAAQLDSPRGLALDGAGNLYIADTRNQRIRRVAAATGVITTFAGTGQAGYSGDNGAAVSARLNLPTALAVDAAGDLFVADTGNHRIRRIDGTTGVMTTVAGTGTQGFAGDNGPAVAARLDSPGGVAVDSSGNLFVADTRNHRIRRVDGVSGTITTVAGTGVAAAVGDGGLASSAALALPRGLAVDASGDVYLADSGNNRVRRVMPGATPALGTIATVAGQGIQAYAGDDGSPAGASMDSPQAVALSPAGALTVADADNARLRQISAVASAAPQIQTVVGLGAKLTTISTGALSLTGPASPTYGSAAELTAALAGGSNATGTVTFVASAGGVATTLGAAAVLRGSAELNVSALAAGTHTVMATYGGDATHAPAQSQPFTVTVAPLDVSAAAPPVTILYGQPIPVVAGTLTGVLGPDSGNVQAVFSSFAGAYAPAGFYPMTASLTGSAAGNYTLVSASGSLTINRAPVTVAVVPSMATVATDSPVAVTVQVLSTTAGVPGGTVTLLDGTAVVAQVGLTAGQATYTAAALAAGAHALTASYSGDANFLPAAASASALVTVGSGADFTLAATGTTAQVVPSGSGASFIFSIGSQGAPLSSPITLAVSGLPTGATASLNPAYIPPGGAVTSFTLTVVTAKTLAGADDRSLRPGGGVRLGAALCGPIVLFVTGLGSRRRLRRRFPRLFVQRRTILAVLACITSATLASGCATRVSTASESQTAPTYTLTVTGTATSAAGTVLQHAVNVTLQVL